MKRKLVTSAIVLLLCASVGVFAAEKSSSAPGLVSYNSPGTIDLSITGGKTWWGLGLNAGLEFTLGRFHLGSVPLSWGITADGSVGFDSAGTGIALAGLPTLNIGFDFGHDLRQIFPFDVRRGIEYAERGASESGLAARVEDIPGQPHAKPGRHGRLPAASAPRNTSRPSRNAFCNSN